MNRCRLSTTLDISPPSTPVGEIGSISQLTFMVIIGLQKPYSKTEVGLVIVLMLMTLQYVAGDV
jgi:hypothetical protein